MAQHSYLLRQGWTIHTYPTCFITLQPALLGLEGAQGDPGGQPGGRRADSSGGRGMTVSRWRYIGVCTNNAYALPPTDWSLR